MKFSCCSAFSLSERNRFVTFLLPARRASKRPGQRTPRVRSGTVRNLCLGREAKDRGAGPESGGGSSEAKQQGSETRVSCGVTGNRSVSGRWQHRKQAGPSPLGGSSGRRQSCEGFGLNTWRLFPFESVVCAECGWTMGALPTRHDDPFRTRTAPKGRVRYAKAVAGITCAKRHKFHQAASRYARTAASNARG